MPGDRRLIFLIADGWRKDLLFALVDGGKLPNIERVFFRGGFVADHMITSFPPVSVSTHASLLTGRNCCNHTIYAMRYLDRATGRSKSYIGLGTPAVNRDLARDSTTIYELFPGDSEAIFEPLNRGAARRSLPTTFKSAAALTMLAKRIERQELKKMTVVWLPSIDTIGHRTGACSESVKKEMRRIDEGLGKMMGALESAGYLDSTHIFFASDHGLRDIRYHFDLRKHFSARGLKVLGWFYQRLYRGRTRYDIAIWSSGHGSAHVYRGDKPGRPDKNEIVEMLLELEPVQLVCGMAGEAAFSVMSSAGEVLVEVRSGDETGFTNAAYSYEVRRGDDPLGLDGTAARNLVGTGFHHADAWFGATTETHYPDFMVQMAQALSAPNAGDVIVTAKDGWNFRDNFHVACHGGWRREDMDVPLMIAGPGIVVGRGLSVRSVDIAPTIAELFELGDESLFDGRSFLADVLREPVARNIGFRAIPLVTPGSWRYNEGTLEHIGTTMECRQRIGRL